MQNIPHVLPRLVSRLASVACLTLCLTIVSFVGMANGMASANQGHAAPVQAMTESDALRLISQSRGKVVLLNFWATWCPPCQAEMPYLQELRDAHPDTELVMVGVSVDQDKRAAERLFTQREFTYQLRHGTGDLMRAFGVDAIPQTVIYNAEGTKVFSHKGFMDFDDMQDEVLPLLEQAKTTGAAAK